MTEGHRPLVSIIIPVYNGSNYMREAIDSALAQTYPDVEILVINDGSTDEGETDRIAKSYGDRIRYFYKENGGVSSALNLGISQMRGSYFSWLSHDDVYMPTKVENAVRALEQAGADENTLVLCKEAYIDGDSKPMRKKQENGLAQNEVLPWNRVLSALLDLGSFNGCSLLIPRATFTKCGGFDEHLRFNQDGFMWSKIFLNGYSLLCIPEIGVLSRIHGKQLTQTGRALFRSDCEAMSQYLIPELYARTNGQDRFLYRYARYNAKHGNREVVKQVRLAGGEKLRLDERLRLYVVSAYGTVRPLIRKLYYRLFWRIRTR